MKRVLQFLSDNMPFYLATVTADGRPRMRPLGFVALQDDKLYFGVGKHKDVYQEMLANPKVEICVTNPRSEWIRIAGNAVMDDNPDVQAKAFAALPMLHDLYNEKTGRVIGFFHIGGMIAEMKDVTGQTVQTITA